MTDTPKPIHVTRSAYAAAIDLLPDDYPAIPAWEDLSISMREAFIHVYHAGAKAALDALEPQPVK
jgi:hypothetical protein